VLSSVKVASGRTGLLLSRPLRTVRESFQLTQLKPFERLVKDAVTIQIPNHRLHDTSPGASSHLHARGRTNSFHCRHLLCLVSRLLMFSRGKDQREVCLLAQSGLPVIPSTTERRLLSPSSVARISIGSPCDDLSPKGEIRVYPVPLERHSNVGPLYTPTVSCRP
jgi:hypothetical protein